MPSKPRLSEIQKHDLYHRYVAADLPPTQFSLWVDGVAAELGVTARQVKIAISQYDEVKGMELRKASVSDARRRAAKCGLTETAVFETLANALHATTKRPLHDRDGNLTHTFEAPDWQARISAANTGAKIHDVFPDAKVHLTIDDSDPRNWPEDRLYEAAAALGIDPLTISPKEAIDPVKPIALIEAHVET